MNYPILTLHFLIFGGLYTLYLIDQFFFVYLCCFIDLIIFVILIQIKYKSTLKNQVIQRYEQIYISITCRISSLILIVKFKIKLYLYFK